MTGLKTKITPNEDGDISAFTNATAAIRTKLTGNSADDDADFDDIVVDGKSAFGQAKDAGVEAADDVAPEATAGDAEGADVAADTQVATDGTATIGSDAAGSDAPTADTPTADADTPTDNQ
ncbi:hypothetical protein [Lacticaseibacillus thailandensis]|uniref:hypothetical protein n=1 Tax=Lacticaseibacillus thailandensis TaxID=381741 RepID=UPI000B0626D1|nr:hypothetical protein [Lacticaseibacillus thailandensis]